MEQDRAVAPLRVLVIEDDVVVRELLEMLLPLEGHTVLSAEGGRQGLQLLESEGGGIDVVLCDLHLPDFTAVELATGLRAAACPATLLIAMSATPTNVEEIPPFEAFLHKPFVPADLTGAVAKARERHVSTPRAEGSPKIGSRSTESLDAEARLRAASPALDEAIFSTLSATLPAGQLLELYAMTLQDVGQRVDRMGAALAAGDVDQYRREAHAIKGGCGMVGAVELRELAAAAEGGAMECTPPLEDFMRACARLRRMLDGRLT